MRSIPCALDPSPARYLGGMPEPPKDNGVRSAEEQVDAYLARFGPERQQLIRAVRKEMQARFPTANELVYDYARNFVIGYSPTLAGGEGLVAISADAEGVRLYLTQGAGLPDPHALLHGKAGARYLQVEDVEELRRPEVEALLAAAVRAAKVPLSASGRGAVVIKPGPSAKRKKKG